MEINQSAPVKQEKQIVIHATPQKVWKTLTNIEQWKDWNSSIKNAKLNGEIAKGTQFIWHSNGSKIKSMIQITHEDKVFGWTGKTFGGTAIHIWYLEKTAQGTLLKVKESMEGWLVSLFKKKMNEILEKDMLSWLTALKRECEK